MWLAFLVPPIFPAILGTGNYLGNIQVSDNAWYSLWSQHTLFSSMFFLPALLGVFCACLCPQAGFGAQPPRSGGS